MYIGTCSKHRCDISRYASSNGMDKKMKVVQRKLDLEERRMWQLDDLIRLSLLVDTRGIVFTQTTFEKESEQRSNEVESKLLGV